MHDFIEDRFPEDISYSSSGGPEFFTDIIVTNSGYEYRNINHINAKYRYNIAPAIKSHADIVKIITFFRKVRGKAIGFRYKDWADYKAVGEYIGKCDGKNTNFQLIKNYSNDVRRITKPVKNTVTISGFDKDSYVVDYTSGLVKFHKPVTGKIYANFEFDVPARFDTDFLNINLENFDAYSYGNIPLVEVA